MKCFLVFATAGLSLLVASAGSVFGQKNPEEDVLFQRAQAFVDAFNQGNAKVVAGFFTSDADIVDPEGQRIKGRTAIEDAYTKFFGASKGAKLFIQISSMRVVRPDLALEDGLTEVVRPGSPPSAARYSAVYVKKDGQWFTESVREAIAVPPNNQRVLGDLAFLVGNWTEDSDKGGTSKASYKWASQGNFIVNSFELAMHDVSVAGGVQWIGWDAAEKKVRSWSFLSNGGFAESTWAPEKSGWKITVSAITRDGKKLTATNVVTKLDNDHVQFQFVNRVLDGQPLPDDSPIRMKRVN